jgi:hypothetical protein
MMMWRAHLDFVEVVFEVTSRFMIIENKERDTKQREYFHFYVSLSRIMTVSQ